VSIDYSIVEVDLEFVAAAVFVEEKLERLRVVVVFDNYHYLRVVEASCSTLIGLIPVEPVMI